MNEDTLKFSGTYIFKALIVIITCLSCNSPSVEVELMLNVEDGFEKTYEFSEKTSGSLLPLEKLNVVKILFDAKKEDAFLFDAQLVSVYTKTDFDGTTEIYDSRKDVSSMSESELTSHKEYEPLLGAAYSFELNDKGEILNAQAQENGVDRELDIFDLNHFQISYPQSKVFIGSTWESTWKNELIVSTTVKAKYKVMKITKNTIEIKSTQTISSSTSLLPDTMKEGEYIINRHTGIVIYMKAKTNLAMGGKLTSIIKQKPD